jgi:hypothetical protein
MLGTKQVSLNVKPPTCGAFAEPSDGLEPSTPSLPWRRSSCDVRLSCSRRLATRFSLLCPFRPRYSPFRARMSRSSPPACLVQPGCSVSPDLSPSSGRSRRSARTSWRSVLSPLSPLRREVKRPCSCRQRRRPVRQWCANSTRKSRTNAHEHGRRDKQRSAAQTRMAEEKTAWLRGGGGGIRTLGGFPLNGFQDRPVRPLRHPAAGQRSAGLRPVSAAPAGQVLAAPRSAPFPPAPVPSASARVRRACGSGAGPR